MDFQANGKEYGERIKTAVFTAVMDASRDPTTNMPMVFSDEATKALLNMIAMLAATSSATSSPTKTREFTDSIAKNLRVQIRTMQKVRAEGGLSFLEVIETSEFH